jgi:hypothetical protein
MKEANKKGKARTDHLLGSLVDSNSLINHNTIAVDFVRALNAQSRQIVSGWQRHLSIAMN